MYLSKIFILINIALVARENEINRIRNALMINDSSEMLYLFGWCTDEERQLFKQFPEFIAVDCTENTNREKRSLLMITGKDGNNTIFTIMRCFLPNSKEETYDTVYRYILPELFGQSVLMNVKIIITDGERMLYEPIQNLCCKELGYFFKDATHRLCEFHLLLQEYRKILSGTSKTEEGNIILEKIYMSLMLSMSASTVREEVLAWLHMEVMYLRMANACGVDKLRDMLMLRLLLLLWFVLMLWFVFVFVTWSVAEKQW